MAGMSSRPKYNVTVPTAYGTMIVNRNDWAEWKGERFGVGWDLMESGCYAQGELDQIKTLVGHCPPDPVLLDIGANIGVHSLFFAGLAGPRGRVYAFEAQRVLFQMLMGNLALNSIENVYARQAAVGAGGGELHLPHIDYARPRNFGGMQLKRAVNQLHPEAGQAAGQAEAHLAELPEAVSVIAIDSLKLERVDFIKADVEGMELDVLQGALATIERCRPLIQVEWLGRDGGALPHHLIDVLGYRVAQSGMNLMCIPVERTGIEIIESMEISLPALRAAFPSA